MSLFEHHGGLLRPRATWPFLRDHSIDLQRFAIRPVRSQPRMLTRRLRIPASRGCLAVDHGYDAHHSGMHVVQQVAVKEPVADLPGVELDHRGAHGFDVDGVLQRRVISLPIQYPEEMAVQVHGVVHHGAVDHNEADYFASSNFYHIRHNARMYMDLRHIAIAVCLGFGAFGADAQSINKWVDENGRTHYGEQPPANSAATRVSEKLTVSGPASSAADDIVLYSTAWCGYCRKARSYMRRNGIAFTEYDIEKDPLAKAD